MTNDDMLTGDEARDIGRDLLTRDEMRDIGRDLIHRGYGSGGDDYDYNDGGEIVVVNTGDVAGIMPGWMAEVLARVEKARQREDTDHEDHR